MRRRNGFRQQCVGLNPPRGIWCHITGTDLVRDGDGQFYVLEDNLRCPSGVSYVLENRQLMKQTFPQVFERLAIRPVDDYREPAAATRCSTLAPGRVAVAARRRADAGHLQLGLLRALVPGPADGHRAGRRPRPRRVGRLRLHAHDEGLRARRRALSPHRRRLPRPEGVPRGLDARRAGADGRLSAGRVALANAPGTGVADDKVVYAYVPQIIKYYLERRRDHLRTCRRIVCWDETQRDARAGEPRQAGREAGNESGGYGMLVGPQLDAGGARRNLRERIKAEPAQLHRPADARAVARARASSTSTSKAGTSTCGRTSSTARTSSCCPAA